MRTYNHIGPSILIGLLALMPATAFAASSIDDSSLAASSSKPTLTGASDAKTVRIILEDENGKNVFTSKEVKVKAGKWKAKITKTLKAGTYEVTLQEKNSKGKRTQADTASLTISGKGSAGAVSASMIPLLMGGAAKSYASVPVAYVKLANTGKATTTVSGITLAETGSAPDSVVSGFAVNDDKGGSRATVNTTFSKGSAFVPLNAQIAPGQIRIYTIKAVLGSTAGSLGTQLKINVSGVSASGLVNGKFPLMGTTFTLGL